MVGPLNKLFLRLSELGNSAVARRGAGNLNNINRGGRVHEGAVYTVYPRSLDQFYIETH